jgi:transcriptional regulator with XRE-family HTH domain
MTYPAYLREKARQLRTEKDLTIDEIAERLAVSRTTAYFWVADLPRPARCQKRKRTPHALGNAAMQAKYRRLREEAYAEGLKSFESLEVESGFTEFVTLFIAEGYKRNRNVVSIANSDPSVIAMSDRWIRRLSTAKVTYQVQYHADQDLQALREFWAGLVGVEPTAIRLQRKSNSNQLKKRSWRSAHGVLTVGVGDTYLRARLQAWIDLLRKRWLDSAGFGA